MFGASFLKRQCCQAEQLTVVANNCRPHNPCDSSENDCLWQPGCSHTGPGTHSCECPPRFYGDGLDTAGGCDQCPAHANTHGAVDTNGDGAIDTLTREACSCDAGYWTGALASGAANQLLTAGGSEVCAATPCPSGSAGPGGGLTSGCPCSPGYYYNGAGDSTLAKWDSTQNGYYACTACPSVANAAQQGANLVCTVSGGGGPISTVDACKPGYTLVSGSTACAIDATDDCTSNRCGAGGTCCDGTFTNANAGCSNNGLNMFTCHCATGYTGGGQDTPCVIDTTDDCSDSPCGPGGTCCDGVLTGSGGCSNDGVGTFSCACAAGYTGGGQDTPCTVDKSDDCSPNPCGAGGTCTDDYAFAYDCSCATYFTDLGQPHNGRCYATGCGQPANPADGTKNPCLNGAKGCTVSGGRAVCACAYGWAGETCAAGRNKYGVQGVHLNPLGLFLCTSTACIWSILGACLPS